MNYSEDWFSNHIQKLQRFSYLANSSCQILEIGSFEGRSSNWFVENFCVNELSRLTCIDTFEGDWEYSPSQTSNLYQRFLDNIKKNSQKIRVIKDRSEFALPRLLSSNECFDFIYVDGSHSFDAVMCDTIYSHNLIKPNGIIVFDDYMRNVETSPMKDIPHHAIKMFLNVHKEEYEVLEMSYQVTVKRKTNR